MRAPDGADFHASVWATAERLIGLRQELARWAARTPLPAERQEDLVLAAYEAMANSAEHAYPDGGGGPLEVTAHCAEDELSVVVADRGRWKVPDPGETVRGRGRSMIGVLSDASATEHRDDGTTVVMRFRFAPERRR
ncbi:ATP-binding protein [Actinomycetospora cinnamomea]|uniref:Histidine kinase-like protein n=1 Tax=Actinomycetospora cinnamomea TaxID=663609 RepID=A0A2U1EAU5_9PSEU|nr:ATP-binding protein [Actinomycetospora cinnamomea]PVY97074.1 histidine kinase-like protein [Actinomycetospora cinnamomea]